MITPGKVHCCDLLQAPERKPSWHVGHISEASQRQRIANPPQDLSQQRLITLPRVSDIAMLLHGHYQGHF